jgi:hypothetical protein
MNNKIAVLILILIMAFPLFADRELGRSEIVKILQHLTNNSRRMWIPEGTIEAALQSFNSITNRTTESNETVRYDGNRFYWEIDAVLDATDKGQDATKLADEAEMRLNQKRIFTWDGQWYSLYFKSAKQVISTNDLTNTPPTITGCLTAGVIPWGYGIYSYERLMNSELDASETESYGQRLIHLNIKSPVGVKLSIVLDPAKDYAALSSAVSSGNSCVLQEYSNYVSKNDRWIPTTILIERYSDCPKAEKLVSYDYWTFNRISTEKPPEAAFNATYEDDSLIEYRPKSANTSLFCRHSSLIDTKDLLYKKLAALNNSGGYSQNCATSALKYVMESLGTHISDANLAAVVNTTDGGTSLLVMQQFAGRVGLQSLALRTDVRQLNSMINYKPILYLPWDKHYVVFDHIENDYVWVIDLANNWFCYNIPLGKFVSAGVEADVIVLLVSNKTINIQGRYTEISHEELAKITGAAGSKFGKYSCTDLIQEYDIEFCQPSPFPLIPCWGRYTVWYNRYGCKEDENGGECIGTGMVGSLFSPCGEDPYYPGSCDITGEWYAKYIRACQ